MNTNYQALTTVVHKCLIFELPESHGSGAGDKVGALSIKLIDSPQIIMTLKMTLQFVPRYNSALSIIFNCS